jgi:RNA polymerase subunit RPABC4/transcription elongation factor Spt4
MYQTNFISQGWECPKCKRVYSPTTSMCSICPQDTVTSSGTTLAHIPFTCTSVTHQFESDKEFSSDDDKCNRCGREKWQHPLI